MLPLLQSRSDSGKNELAKRCDLSEIASSQEKGGRRELVFIIIRPSEKIEAEREGHKWLARAPHPFLDELVETQTLEAMGYLLEKR
jgi:hypothetical protein